MEQITHPVRYTAELDFPDLGTEVVGPASDSGLARKVRRVLNMFVGGRRDTGRAPARREVSLLTGRIRTLARWVETSAEMLRTTSGEEVRSLFSRFLREELGVATVKFVPKALAGSLLGRITLELPNALGNGLGESVELTLHEHSRWDRSAQAMAERAAEMTDAVLVSLARLEDIRTQSLTDDLTGLYNRRSLDRMLEREVLLAVRHHVPFSVVAIDIDFFKKVNDTQGHAAGDILLRHVANSITTTLRRSDLAFRPGGDEFVVLLPQTNLSQALAAMEKIRQALANTPVPAGVAAIPTLSIGVAESWPTATAMELLHAADAALYAAKREARNCVRVHRAAA